MREFTRFGAALIIACTCCGVFGADTQPASQPATQPAVEAIRYERNGGFSGTHDVVEISKTGQVVIDGRLLGIEKGQLKADQITKLAAFFSQWGTLKASYPAPKGAADAFEYKIRWGNTEITASDANKDLPATFKAARDAIEKVARSFTED